MSQIDINKMVERRIAELASLLKQLLIESSIVILYHLHNNWQFLVSGLQQHMSALALAAGTPAYLRHHHKSMLVGTEIGIVQHGVGIEDANY